MTGWMANEYLLTRRTAMVNRKDYMDMLTRMKDHKVIKVITGVRRCGKSTLLQMFQESLMKAGTEEQCCISVNFEDLRFEKLKEYHRLYEYIMDRLVPGKMNYIFLDEIQE